MILEITLIVLSTLFFIQSIRMIFNRTSTTVADYIMIIIYVFNCLPVLFDNILGIPNYLSIGSWFQSFEKSMNDDFVRSVYNFYLLFVIILLRLYIYKRKTRIENVEPYVCSQSRLLHDNVMLIIAFVPVFLAVAFGHWQEYLVFMSATNRGLSGSQVSILMFFELLGLFSFYCWFFEYNSGRLKSYVWIILYTAIILWIDGKRYLIVTAVIMFIFFYLNSMYFNKKRIPLKTLLIFGGCCFVIFYIGYTFAYKVNTDIAGIRF